MKEGVLLDYVKKAGLPTGALSAYYNLSGSVDTLSPDDRNNFYKLTSGSSNDLDTYVVFNQLHNSGSQLYDSGDGNFLINGDNYPAIINSSSTSITGSGNFDGASSLMSSHRVTGGSWTCFLDFSGGYSEENSNLSQVLISSMTGVNCSSGLNVGINGSNRLYYEYITGAEGENRHRHSETLPNHLKKLNLVSVSKSPHMLEVSLHKPNEGTVSIKSPLNNYTDSEELFWGGFSDGGGYSGFYTGFSGYINTIGLFHEHIPEVSRNTIADSFFLESYSDAGLITGERITKQVTGVEVQSIQTGWGATGYKLVAKDYHKNQDGDNVPVYALSGIEGRLYKEVLVDLTGDRNISSITGRYIGETPSRNPEYVDASNAVPGQITFVESLAVGESVEIYSHSKYLNTINYNSDTEYFFETVKPNSDEKIDVHGYQIKNDDLTFDSLTSQPFIQVFRNGIAQQEVSGLHSVSDIFNNIGGNLKEVGDRYGIYKGDYFINENSAGPNGSAGVASRINNNRYEIVLNSKEDGFKSDDSVNFDIVSGPSLTGDYPGSNVHFTGEYLNRDVYLNGRKLLSGHEYSESSTAGKTSYLLDAVKIGADNNGELLFLPQASTDFSRVTGEDGGEAFDVDNVFFEQVWRNGIRQIPGIDYFRAPKNSLIGTGGASYTNESFEFRESQQKIDALVNDFIPESKGKLFSFSADGKANLFTTSS